MMGLKISSSSNLYYMLFVTLLSGCATMSEEGVSYLNKGQHQAAYNTFIKCANEGNSNCMNNIGYMYSHGHMQGGRNEVEANKWYTLSARYGNETARKNLRNNGASVPPADLEVNQSYDGLGYLLLGMAQGYQQSKQNTSSYISGNTGISYTAYYTGEYQSVRTVTNQNGVQCQYRFSGKTFVKIFVGSICPFSILVK